MDNNWFDGPYTPVVNHLASGPAPHEAEPKVYPDNYDPLEEAGLSQRYRLPNDQRPEVLGSVRSEPEPRERDQQESQAQQGAVAGDVPRTALLDVPAAAPRREVSPRRALNDAQEGLQAIHKDRPLPQVNDGNTVRNDWPIPSASSSTVNHRGGPSTVSTPATQGPSMVSTRARRVNGNSSQRRNHPTQRGRESRGRRS